MQVKQLDAQRGAQMRQIEAQADRQKEAADTAYARTALAAGLQENIQEQQFDNQMSKMQEAARLQANQFEFQYSFKDRQEMAKLNDAERTLAQDDTLDDQSKARMSELIMRKRAGITGGSVPASPGKQIFKEGRAPGDEFEDQGGNWHMVMPDGTPKMTLRRDQGPEAAKQKHEQDMELKRMEHEISRAKDVQNARFKLLTTMKKVTDSEGVSHDTPMYSAPVIERMLQEAGFAPQQQPAQEPDRAQLEQELQRRVTAIKQAKEFLRAAEEKYKDVNDIPPDVLAEIIRADDMVKNVSGVGR